MRIGQIIISAIVIGFIIFFIVMLISLMYYTVLFIEWKGSQRCDEIYSSYVYNSPLVKPEELNEFPSCYTFTMGGNSKGIKLFENGNYIGDRYGFKKYKWDLFSTPYITE